MEEEEEETAGGGGGIDTRAPRLTATCRTQIEQVGKELAVARQLESSAAREQHLQMQLQQEQLGALGDLDRNLATELSQWAESCFEREDVDEIAVVKAITLLHTSSFRDEFGLIVANQLARSCRLCLLHPRLLLCPRHPRIRFERDDGELVCMQ